MGMRSRGIIAIVSLAILLLSGCVIDDGPQKRKVAIIFCDVTSSLLEVESQEVSRLGADVLDALPPGTEYRVFPIQMDPLRLEPIESDKVVVETNSSVDQTVKKQRREHLKATIESLYKLVKAAKAPPTPYGKPDNHSCILYTLDYASQYLKQFPSDKYDRELIYVSDMIEECNVTPMHKPISLASTDISSAIQLARETNVNIPLADVRISVIIPATSATYVAGPRPNVTDLRTFWENVLLHCGFTERTLTDQNDFYFSSGLPARFKPLNPAQ